MTETLLTIYRNCAHVDLSALLSYPAGGLYYIIVLLVRILSYHRHPPLNHSTFLSSSSSSASYLNLFNSSRRISGVLMTRLALMPHQPGNQVEEGPPRPLWVAVVIRRTPLNPTFGFVLVLCDLQRNKRVGN